MLSHQDLAIARAHAEHDQDDLVLDLLDHIQALQKLLDQAKCTPKSKPAPAPRRQDAGTRGQWHKKPVSPDQDNATTKPKRPAWYPKTDIPEPRIIARKP